MHLLVQFLPSHAFGLSGILENPIRQFPVRIYQLTHQVSLRCKQISAGNQNGGNGLSVVNQNLSIRF